LSLAGWGWSLAQTQDSRDSFQVRSTKEFEGSGSSFWRDP